MISTRRVKKLPTLWRLELILTRTKRRNLDLCRWQYYIILFMLTSVLKTYYLHYKIYRKRIGEHGIKILSLFINYKKIHWLLEADTFKETRMEGNVLFNDTLNTFYLRLYDVEHMVKDHSDSKRVNLLLPHGLLFPISSKGSFICTITQTR